MSWLFYSALQNSKEGQRDVPTLFNFYYRYKISNSLKAKEALDLILQQSPNNQIAMRAMIDWYLRQGDTHAALNFMVDKYRQDPDDDYIGYELLKLYISLNDHENATIIFKHLLLSKNKTILHQAQIIYESAYPIDKPNLEIAGLASFITPINFSPPMDFSPLYKKVQDMMHLQPNSAKQVLLQIISIDKNAQEAYVLLGYIELQKKQIHEALPYFVKAFAIKPSTTLALQLGYIYAELKNIVKATEYFNYVIINGTEPLKKQSQKALYVIKNQLPFDSSILSVAIPQVQSPEDKLWNVFYQNKTINIPLAWRAIDNLLILNPFNIRALKEAAYFSTAQHMNERAIEYWKRAYAIEPNPEYAMSIGYLYDGIDRKLLAFRYFDLASKTSNMALHDKAEMAMTNMGGGQFKFLPKPYFMEFYSAPFYFSRFDLGVLPTILRSGVTLNETYRTELYLSYRRTKDNRSGIQGLIIQNSISQIFEDNVAIYAAGFRTSPWPQIPLQTFIESGVGEDLIYRNRPKWQRDLRGGLVYYNAWGATAGYTDKLEFPFKWVSTFYADLIYYSRYNNLIGTTWFRPGIRAATFQSAVLDVYLANYYLVDKNREFYNNTYSVGPGIAIRPSNRVNVVIRLESLQGFYVPVNSPTPNRYRSKYYNNIAMVEFFMRF